MPRGIRFAESENDFTRESANVTQCRNFISVVGRCTRARRLAIEALGNGCRHHLLGHTYEINNR